MRDEDFSTELLAWYDRHARVMPWRIGPVDRQNGLRPDPYRVWLSEIMLQQTTVITVRDYFLRFTARWPDIRALAAAKDAAVLAEWAGLGYYARARNLLKCARKVVTDHSGKFPTGRDALLALPGIGPYTAAAIAAIAFDQPATVVDGNVERVIARLFAVKTPLPAAKPALTALATRLTPPHRSGDHAQAMMDLGATICTPRKPACSICPLISGCLARTKGIASDLPQKTARAAKPTRYGIAYVAMRPDRSLFLQQRPERGLLGGMLGWPGTDWTAQPPSPAPPLLGDWQEAADEIRHSFTHFHLRLKVLTARLPARLPTDIAPANGRFIAADGFRPDDLPTLMRKVFEAARPALQDD